MHGTSSTPNEIEPLFTKPNLTQMCLQKRVRDSLRREDEAGRVEVYT